jgi:hypothetical protein
MTGQGPEPRDLDAEIMAGLGRIFGRLDPMPPVLDDAVILALATADLDAELALLVDDARETVRGNQSRVLRFATATTTVLLSITAGDADRVRLEGWLDPAQEATITVRRGGGATSTTKADSFGRFAFDGLPAGSARVVAALADGGRLATPVLRL